ncbi:MAG: 50S ribosomal protein L13 [Sedimentisphaerales bacterium]|nr:50S ribosomal protein L13 [Sedimentisphaerales bacterium]
MQAKQQKTTLAQKGDVPQNWHLVDADGQILGRLASSIAVVLMGKHRPAYTPHVDTGDFVIVTNCEKVRLTGRKAEDKQYEHYTYYNDGRKIIPYAEMIKRKPEKVISEAVRRMLPKSKLGRRMLSKLKVYRGGEHPHAAQQPRPLECL